MHISDIKYNDQRYLHSKQCFLTVSIDAKKTAGKKLLLLLFQVIVVVVVVQVAANIQFETIVVVSMATFTLRG